jgi:hypothetical protein
MQATETQFRTETKHHGPNGKPLMGLFSDLWRETSTLVHDEAELAKAELSEKVSQLGSGAAEIAASGAVLFAGLLFVLGAATGGLWLMIDNPHAVWIAPLIVGVVVMVVGYVLLQRGKQNLQARNLAPERTLQSLRDDVQLARRHAS